VLKFFAILQRVFAKFFARAERFAKKIAKINNLQRFLQVFCKENCNFVKLILFCTKLSYILQFAKVFANLRIFANCKQLCKNSAPGGRLCGWPGA
jgi:hypothetical protein